MFVKNMPIPLHISQEVQDFLAPTVTTTENDPAPQSTEEWLAFVEATNTSYKPFLVAQFACTENYAMPILKQNYTSLKPCGMPLSICQRGSKRIKKLFVSLKNIFNYKLKLTAHRGIFISLCIRKY